MQDITTITNYVNAALELHEVELYPQQRQRVIDTFMMTATIAGPLLAFEIPIEIEAALVFTPE
jgi:hypothetical protein